MGGQSDVFQARLHQPTIVDKRYYPHQPIPKLKVSALIETNAHISGTICNVNQLLKELGANFPTADGIHLPPINNNLLFYSALLHPSKGNQLDKRLSSLLPATFYRLAFLGDAALTYHVAFILQEKYSEATVGNLTALRSKIVSRNNLAEFCKSVGLKDKIVASSGIQEQVNVQGEAFEAYIGALCLDYNNFWLHDKLINARLLSLQKKKNSTANAPPKVCIKFIPGRPYGYALKVRYHIDLNSQNRLSCFCLVSSQCRTQEALMKLTIDQPNNFENQTQNFPKNITPQVLNSLIESIRPKNINSSRIFLPSPANSNSDLPPLAPIHPRLSRRRGGTMTQIRLSVSENFIFHYEVRKNRGYRTNTNFNVGIIANEILALTKPTNKFASTKFAKQEMENNLIKWIQRKKIPEAKMIPMLEDWMAQQIDALTDEEKKAREMKRKVKRARVRYARI
ncbi:hypothetical protein G9A89_010090 [Geosiphon pyriformis]|nr:hypothetical protein G9A89_010090 [Geosiphon pyriformis]